MGNKVWKKITTTFLNVVTAFQSLSWRKDNSVVLIGSWFGEKFADNSRFMFQYLSDHKDELGLTHVVWVSRVQKLVELLVNMGYEAYLLGSDESIHYHKLAKYHLICNFSNSSNEVKTDILTAYSHRAIRVNLWHGVIGFKGVGMSSQGYITEKKKHPVIWNIYERLHSFAVFRKFIEQPGGWGDCYYLSTSPLKTQLMMNSFRMPNDHYIETGFPRVSGAVRLLSNEIQVLRIMKNYRKTVIYLPTFRNIKGSTFGFHKAATSMVDYLEENNVLWIQKGHSASSDKASELKQEGNILTLPHDFDINTIIPYISLMVSDYSSAMGDAMYYYKPLVFYVPDFDEYRKNDRGFQRDPDEIMCGPKARNTEELVRYIHEALVDSWEPDEKYLSVRNEYYAHEKTLGEIWQDIVTATK